MCSVFGLIFYNVIWHILYCIWVNLIAKPSCPGLMVAFDKMIRNRSEKDEVKIKSKCKTCEAKTPGKPKNNVSSTAIMLRLCVFIGPRSPGPIYVSGCLKLSMRGL